MARKGSPEYKEARKQARRETFNSKSVFPKLVEADRAHNRLWEARNRGARTTQARKEVRERFAEYNEAFDAGVARRMGEDKPKGRARKRGKTAHIGPGNENGGQFTGPGKNEPRPLRKPSGGIKPKAAPKPRAPRTASQKLNSAERAKETRRKKKLDEAFAGYQANFGNWPRSREEFDREYEAEAAKQKRISDEQIPRRKPKSSAPRKAKASGPAAPKAKKGGYEEWARERDRLRNSFKGGGHSHDSEVMAQIIGLQSDHPRYADRYIREHPDLYGDIPALKPKASAPTKRTRYDIWRERNPGRPKSEYVPRQGNRTRRTKAQATVEYLDARGRRHRRA